MRVGVQHAFVDHMSQVSVGYPESPMNGPAHRSLHPAPGQRMAPIAGAPAFGRDVPIFTLAPSSPSVTNVLASYPRLLNEALERPPTPDGVWLIRPDGYVAATSPVADLSSISGVLGGLIR